MRMNDLRVRHISHRVTSLHGRGRIDHVLIKNGTVHKPFQLAENVFAIRVLCRELLCISHRHRLALRPLLIQTL